MLFYTCFMLTNFIVFIQLVKLRFVLTKMLAIYFHVHHFLFTYKRSDTYTLKTTWIFSKLFENSSINTWTYLNIPFEKKSYQNNQHKPTL